MNNKRQHTKEEKNADPGTIGIGESLIWRVVAKASQCTYFYNIKNMALGIFPLDVKVLNREHPNIKPTTTAAAIRRLY